MCCSVLQCVLQCVAVCCLFSHIWHTWQRSVCYNEWVVRVLQCFAACVALCCIVRCTVVQCVAVGGLFSHILRSWQHSVFYNEWVVSVLQCVAVGGAVCGSVLSLFTYLAYLIALSSVISGELVCCDVLQCALHCVLRCVAVCVALWCTVLQCVVVCGLFSHIWRTWQHLEQFRKALGHSRAAAVPVTTLECLL